MKAYLVPVAPIGYGPRIFIPYEFHTPEVMAELKRLSTWGGLDKDTGKCYGYEFPSCPEDESPYFTKEDKARFTDAKSFLVSLGFKLENQSPENQAEVWA